ncbi:MAG: xylulokinase [Jatrophihabitantaceae bacterium]
MTAQLVAGVDSSTQSCKVVIRDAETGALVRQGRASHPAGTEIDPERWWQALQRALAEAGGLDDVSAISIGGQQHGMVCLDQAGQVVRPALLWNDTRSAQAAADLVAEYGPAFWAEAVGIVPIASFTITKLRWLAEHEPEQAARTAAVCLPHDWLSWRLAQQFNGPIGIDGLITDRSDASGTGYFDSRSNQYRVDLLVAALGHPVVLPAVAGPAEVGYRTDRLLIGPGAGDNAAGALGVQAGDEVLVSLGTSGVACARSAVPAVDPTGTVAGFADASGGYLPLVCTLNAARVLDAAARLLGVDLAEFGALALAAEPGAGGLVVVPYLEGERTPNLPHATGALHGWTLVSGSPANLARAAVEGMLCGLADALDALAGQGVPVTGVRLIGGAAQSPAVRQIAPTVFGVPVAVPAPGKYVADGAARQAAWVLATSVLGETATAPSWQLGELAHFEGPPTPDLRLRYAEACGKFLNR